MRFDDQNRLLNKKFAIEKQKWSDLPSSPGFGGLEGGLTCNFTDNFSFEIIIYGKKMEQNIDRLKRYMDESHIRVDRDWNSLSVSNFFGVNALDGNRVEYPDGPFPPDNPLD